MKNMKYALVCVALALAGCGFLTKESNWNVARSGYNLDAAPGSDSFSIEVHLNELKQRGGDVKTAEFKLFVAERLKRHGACPNGWELLPCTQTGECVTRTSHSVVVQGRCLAP
jgi:hypothetical protein